MTFSWYAAGAAFLLLGSACSRSPEAGIPERSAAAQGSIATSLLRIPRGGGAPLLYRASTLDTVGWKASDRLPPVRQVVGADPEQGIVFVLDRANNLVALDLDTRRVRTQLRQVRTAVMGPDGVVYAVDTDGNVTRLVRRAPVRFRTKLPGTPRELHAAASGALLARVGGSQPALEVLTADQKPASIPLPDGAVTTTHVGDLIAVAADTAVVLYSTDPAREPLSIRVPGGARAAAFSPSGHVLYVVGERASVTVVDRYGHEVLERIDLPGPARELRSDFYGRWLLAQPETGDSIWVVDIGTHRYVGTVAAPWGRDLPVVASPNTILVRQGDDLVALDLESAGFPERGRIQDGADDFWLPIAWHPAGDAPSVPAPEEEEPSPDETADSADIDAEEIGPASEVYLQLSSSRNPTWAEQLVTQLRSAGLPASMLPPTTSEDPYRVVLGPYATREQAEEISRGLGMPSFVITTPGH